METDQESNVEAPYSRPQRNSSQSNDIDPNFEERTGLHPELIPDWLAILIQENSERVQNVCENFNLFVDPSMAQYVFTICLRLRLPQDVKYLALGIFNEFMYTHLSGLYALVSCLPEYSNEQKIKEWEKIESNVSRQLPLRVLSCIQIASKVHSYRDSLCAKKVQHCLRSLGLSYTEEAVRKSEVRVLSAVEYCVNVGHSPVVYIESMLNILILRKNDDSVNARTLWEYSMLLLDCVFLQQDLIYKRLLISIHGVEAQHLAKDRIIRLQADYMLLASGLILAASVCVLGTDFADEAMPILSGICKITEGDVRDMSLAIMKVIMEHGDGQNSGQLLSID